MEEDKQIDDVYMQRRKPSFIKKGEISRDYRRHDLSPADYLFACDWEEIENVSPDMNVELEEDEE